MAEVRAGGPTLADGTRPWPLDAPLGAPPRPCIAVPADEHLDGLSRGRSSGFRRGNRPLALSAARRSAQSISTPFFAAGRLLYDGAFVAERFAAVGAFIVEHPDAVDPAVRTIIDAASATGGHSWSDDGETARRLPPQADEQLAGTDALMVPTVPRHPTIAEVGADPLAVNAELGRFTTFANLLDLCGISIPAGSADGGQFGVTLLASAFNDRRLAALAESIRR